MQLVARPDTHYWWPVRMSARCTLRNEMAVIREMPFTLGKMIGVVGLYATLYGGVLK